LSKRNFHSRPRPLLILDGGLDRNSGSDSHTSRRRSSTETGVGFGRYRGENRPVGDARVEKIVGWPKLRRGSITTKWSRPMGPPSVPGLLCSPNSSPLMETAAWSFGEDLFDPAQFSRKRAGGPLGVEARQKSRGHSVTKAARAKTGATSPGKTRPRPFRRAFVDDRPAHPGFSEKRVPRSGTSIKIEEARARGFVVNRLELSGPERR